MSKFVKPIFTKDELDEQKTNIDVGYKYGALLPGYDFESKPLTSKFKQEMRAAIERINGTAKKRAQHEKINSFGWAKLGGNSLYFGLKWSSLNGMGPSRIGQSAIKKYKQLLGYLLEQAGWKGIKYEGGEYEVPLNNPDNIKNLYVLSPSIGFHYKGIRPDLEFMEKMEFEIKYKGNQQNLQSSRGEHS